MKKLFSKAAVMTDLHFGDRSDSPVHNQDCLEFIDWFISHARERKVDRIICIGDWFDNRSRIRLDTLQMGNYGMRKLKEVAPVDVVVGNHDMFYRDKRTIHSLDGYQEWEGINIYSEPTTINGVGFCPFLVGPEYLEVADIQAEYIFGHFELPHFLMNSTIEMPDKGGLNADHFVHPRMIFSGHFHKRQLKTNQNKVPIWYIGSPFGHDFNDVNDTERGMMILEWGKDPEFIDWNEGPLYQRFQISELVEMIENTQIPKHTRAKSVIEVHDDLGLELEDISLIREEMLSHVREVRIRPSSLTPGLDMETDIEDIDTKDLNQVVIEHLMQIDPRDSDIDPELLVNMFEGK